MLLELPFPIEKNDVTVLLPKSHRNNAAFISLHNKWRCHPNASEKSIDLLAGSAGNKSM